MRRLFHTPTFTAALILFLIGCASGPPGHLRQGAQVASTIGNYQVHYELPDPIPLNEPFSLKAWVGPKPESTQLVVDAGMPHHHHGMNQQPQIEQQADGSYTVDGMLFHMPGYWEIYFDITRGPVTERAQVSVEIE